MGVCLWVFMSVWCSTVCGSCESMEVWVEVEIQKNALKSKNDL